ncbi:MAG: hypothetical protein A2068_07265 [Ignavibacteria bacterium GWB2_35_6b]|nr:MAG: hypothetical protein A2068_07265 [Ignavibacteria bacterium GWB2_35_6b]
MKADMKTSIKYFSFLIIIFLAACSTTQETTKEEPAKEQIYVFDDGAADTTITTTAIEIPEQPKDTVNFIRDEVSQPDTMISQSGIYTVQLGAFSTKEKADLFVAENQKDIAHNLEVQYSTKVNLFVVWLSKFSTKEEAETVRNDLWKKEKFKDAFIVTVE